MPNANDVIISVAYGHAYAGHADEFNNPKYGPLLKHL